MSVATLTQSEKCPKSVMTGAVAQVVFSSSSRVLYCASGDLQERLHSQQRWWPERGMPTADSISFYYTRATVHHFHSSFIHICHCCHRRLLRPLLHHVHCRHFVGC